MIDHITFGISDFGRSVAFYDRAFAPLGVKRLVHLCEDKADTVKIAAYGDSRPWLWLVEENATTGVMHIALQAQCRADVDAFHAAAICVGGKDNGPPGLRPHYHPNYYAAFVLDPDGHNIEAVCR